MRGKVRLTRLDDLIDRITPAYAGKREARTQKKVTIGDHPRICGEKHDYFTSCLPSPGSPPHMRGKVNCLGLLLSGSRITPAYAGKSSEEATDAVWFQDHPRICGEKFASFLNPLRRQGSPPHMRGKVREEEAGRRPG